MGGVGEYFNINPVFLRIIYVLLSISSPFTMTIMYILFTAIVPLETDVVDEESNFNKINNKYFLAISLIVLGIILLANNFLPFYFPNFLSTIKYYTGRLINFWPILFIILGIYLLVDKNR